jgi:hypothetical protein
MKMEKSVNWWIIASLLMSCASMLRGTGTALPAGQVSPRFTSLTHEITLQDDRICVAFDSGSGALTRLEDKATHWIIERRPELGVSFRLFAPLPERRWNPVLGQKQSAAEVKKVSAYKIRLQWKNLISENGGILPMTLTADVTLTNGVLTFNATLKNDSALTVETIDYLTSAISIRRRVTPPIWQCG